jgi:methylenetetrahydrofolate reductase (NADPH)
MEMRMTNVADGSKPTFSFELFPPKDAEGEARLWATIESLDAMAPDFIAVTYGAGGSTRDRTIRITSEITAHTKVPTIAHLTCVGSTREELIEILTKYREAGITNILALRGDPVGGPRAEWVTTPGGFDHSDQLVSLAAEMGGFTIGVAAFPDCHPASNGDFDRDIDVLLEKERRGATFATTQFFFEAERWIALVERLQARGSSMPVIPGILPVTNVKQLIRMSELTGTPLPTALPDAFAKVEDNPEDVRKLGVDVATELAEKLIAAGAPGIHFYTMNSSTATREVFERIKGHR